MTVLLIISALIFSVAGIVAAVLPIIPGPPLSWLAVLFVFLIPEIPMDTMTVLYAFLIATAIFILDFVIQGIATKRFGGSKKGVYGSMVGLILGLVLPIPMGIFVGTFVGAMVGEYMTNKDWEKSIRPALGSIIGLLISVVFKISLALAYMALVVKVLWDYREEVLSLY